jgi:protein-disulfide isomerase
MAKKKPPRSDNPGAVRPSASRSQARERAAALAREQQQKERRRRVVIQVGIGLAIFAVVIGTTFALLSARDDQLRESASRGPTPAQVDDNGSFAVGNPSAPVTVQVVEDFQCPICKQFEAASGSLLAEYAAGDDVKVEYRGIAFLDRMSSTRYSSRALNASACVMPEGQKVWQDFHRSMFEQQPPEGSSGLPDSALVDIATSAGADESAVRPCIEDEKYAGWVTRTTLQSSDDGIDGTPTVFVDGKKLDSVDPDSLRAAVAAAQQS